MAPGRHQPQHWVTFLGALVGLVLARVEAFFAHLVRRLGGHLELDEALPLDLGRRFAVELAGGGTLALTDCGGHRCVHPAHVAWGGR